MIDPFGRKITYLRVSVTDRCDLRCVYCMAEQQSFLPKAEVLTLEEIERICAAFLRHGTETIRITGGEPLVRRGVLGLIERLGGRLGAGSFKELTLTTNGTQLASMAPEMAAAGILRVNVSLDSLDPATFHAVTRWGDLGAVLKGIDGALAAGLQIKINTVVLKGVNDHQIPEMMRWAHGLGMDLSLIETMPMGDVQTDRFSQYVPLSKIRTALAQHFTLTESSHRTSGPARYVDVAETGGRLGFITPLTHNFCESCNRVRLTCTGKLYMCLGQEDAADLRGPLRASPDDGMLDSAIAEAIARKPKGHDFQIDRGRPAVSRTMSVTGG